MTSDKTPLITSAQRRRASLQARTTGPLTPSADVAATAIEYVLARKARRRTGAADLPLPESLRRTDQRNLGLAKRSLLGSWSGKSVAMLIVLGLGGIIAAVCVWHGAPDRPVARYSVQGTVTLRGRPLTNSVVEFHRLDESRTVVETAFTDSQGHFAIGDSAGTGVPSGAYGIVVRGRRKVVRQGEVFFSHVPLPSHYADPEDSPLKARIHGPTPRLSLVITP